jgi:hypothetical protein
MSVVMNPDMKGLVQMQMLLMESIEDHNNNPSSHDHLTRSKTIFHLLLDSEAKKESQNTKILQESFFKPSFKNPSA